MQAHASLKLSLQLKPWEDYKRSIHQKLRYRGMACTDRQRDVFNCCWWKLRRQHRQLNQQVLVKDSFADVSQSVSRLPVQRGNLLVFTTSSVRSHLAQAILAQVQTFVALVPRAFCPPREPRFAVLRLLLRPTSPVGV